MSFFVTTRVVVYALDIAISFRLVLLLLLLYLIPKLI